MDRILVIDDESSILKLLDRLLTQESYNVSTADNGGQALKLLALETFDVVLSDLKMPDTNGIELLKKIKNLYPQTEVIIMTGQATIESAIEAIKNGAYDYILKPFNIGELTSTIKKCLEYSRLRRQENIFRETTHLYQLAQEITKTRSEKDLLQFILERAAKTLHADAGSIFIINPSKEELTPMAVLGQKDNIASDMKFGEKIVGWVATKREPLLIQDGFNNLPQFKDLETRHDIVSSMVSPLINQEVLMGVICLNRFVNATNYQFTLHDLESLKIFVLHATLIITALQHYEAMQQLDELKTEFMANVSHELRTPLMAIGGAVELLSPILEPYFENNKIKIFLDLIKRNTGRMQFLISDLLDFSRIETNRMKLEPTSFQPQKLIDEIVEDFTVKAREKNINLITDAAGQCELTADRERIKQVISNLVANALKFTPEQGTVKIRLTSEGGSRVVFTVTDTGIGIPKDKHDKIFEKFYQVDGSVCRAHAGFGLGLAIVKSIVEKHGGKIWVESEIGKGSSFFVDLPSGGQNG